MLQAQYRPEDKIWTYIYVLQCDSVSFVDKMKTKGEKRTLASTDEENMFLCRQKWNISSEWLFYCVNQ